MFKLEEPGSGVKPEPYPFVKTRIQSQNTSAASLWQKKCKIRGLAQVLLAFIFFPSGWTTLIATSSRICGNNYNKIARKLVQGMKVSFRTNHSSTKWRIQLYALKIKFTSGDGIDDWDCSLFEVQLPVSPPNSPCQQIERYCWSPWCKIWKRPSGCGTTHTLEIASWS